jgi:hypothetical protein
VTTEYEWTPDRESRQSRPDLYSTLAQAFPYLPSGKYEARKKMHYLVDGIGGELQVAMPLHSWPYALSCATPRPALSPARTYLMDRIGEELGVTTPRLALRPKSLSPKSHAHPARG